MIVMNEDYNEMMPLDLTERTASMNISSSKERKDETPPIELQRIDTSDIQSPCKDDCRHSSNSLSSSVTAASTTSGEHNPKEQQQQQQQQQQQHTRIHSPSSKSPRQLQKTQVHTTTKREVPIYIPQNWGCRGFSMEPIRRPQTAAAAAFPNQDDLSDISSCIDKEDDEDTNKEYHKSLNADNEPSTSMVQNLLGFVSSVVVRRQPQNNAVGRKQKNSSALDVHGDDLSMRYDTIIGKDIIIVSSSSIGMSQSDKRRMSRWYQSS